MFQFDILEGQLAYDYVWIRFFKKKKQKKKPETNKQKKKKKKKKKRKENALLDGNANDESREIQFIGPNC